MSDHYQQKHRRNQQYPSSSCSASSDRSQPDGTFDTSRPRRTVASLVLPANNILKEQCWRRYGKARRRELLEQDNVEFRINPSCDIQKYFSLAERVSVFQICYVSLTNHYSPF